VATPERGGQRQKRSLFSFRKMSLVAEERKLFFPPSPFQDNFYTTGELPETVIHSLLEGVAGEREQVCGRGWAEGDLRPSPKGCRT